MLSRNHPDRIRIVFDDHRLVANAGLLLPATLAQHLGLGELVDHHLNLGSAPGRANTGDKMPPWLPLPWRAAIASTTHDALRAGGTAGILDCRVKACAIHPGHFPAQLPLGPCPSTGPGEPGVAGPGLGRWGGTRRRAVHHRPRFHHLRDLRTGQGGGATPRLYRQAGLSPVAGRGRRHRGRVDVAGCARAGPTLFGVPPTSCARRWDGCATPAPEVNSRCWADSGFYAHAIVAVCRSRWMSASITIRQHKSLRHLSRGHPGKGARDGLVRPMARSDPLLDGRCRLEVLAETNHLAPFESATSPALPRCLPLVSSTATAFPTGAHSTATGWRRLHHRPG